MISPCVSLPYPWSLARLTLGLPASPELSKLPKARCACGFLRANDPVDRLMPCKGANQAAIIKRHDRLNKTTQATTVPVYASLHRANRNITKYDAQVKKQGGVFLSLIAETFGGFHKKT
jgi:hypothetical protein